MALKDKAESYLKLKSGFGYITDSPHLIHKPDLRISDDVSESTMDDSLL